MRAQVELPALAVAVLVLTLVLVLGLGVATTAFDSAERSPTDRHAAASLADELVAESSPVTARENVIVVNEVRNLTSEQLHEEFALPAEARASVQVDGTDIASPDVPVSGTTVERLVLLQERTGETVEPDFEQTRTVVLPRRSGSVSVNITPPEISTVRSVRANDETVLRNDSGLRGTFDIDVSPLETTELWFETAGPMPVGSVELDYETAETRKATLAVTVDG